MLRGLWPIVFLELRSNSLLCPQVRAGFQKIEGTVTGESPASAGEIEELKTIVDEHCPVKDMMNVPINISLNHVKTYQ